MVAVVNDFWNPIQIKLKTSNYNWTESRTRYSDGIRYQVEIRDVENLFIIPNFDYAIIVSVARCTREMEYEILSKVHQVFKPSLFSPLFPSNLLLGATNIDDARKLVDHICRYFDIQINTDSRIHIGELDLPF